jgi:DNA-binding CsgD family transcriptional regulator
VQQNLSQSRLLGDLIQSLNSTESASDFCRTLVHFVLKEEQAVAAYLLKLTEDSRLKLVGSYGYSPLDLESFNISVWDPSPSAVAVRGGRPVVNSQDTGTQVLLIPLMRSLGPVGCLGIDFRDEVGTHLLSEESQWAFQLAGGASINRFGPRDQPSNATRQAPTLSLQEVLDGLSKRQLLILEHITEQKTNVEIARLMNLSESAIKKETVAIFKLLAVNSRTDARKIAIQFGIAKKEKHLEVAESLVA